MFGIVRKIGSCLANLCLLLVHALCRKKQQEGDDRDNVRWHQGVDSDDKWDAEGWDDFSVKVVPSEVAAEQRPLNDLQAGEPSGNEQGTDQAEMDLFEDMKPVFRKPTKIHIYNRASEQKQVNFSKFAVQDSVFREEVVGELGAWSEDEGVEGWEEKLAPEEGHLVHDSQEAIKKKKAYDREKRRKAQEVLRNQQRTVNSNTRLGTRVT